jgi:hypothetical protein
MDDLSSNLLFYLENLPNAIVNSIFEAEVSSEMKKITAEMSR